MKREQILAVGERTPEGCLLWPKAKNKDGYGVVRFEGKLWLIHRLAWHLQIGPIPEGHEIDHVYRRGCDNRHCYEQSHLEPVTHKTNMGRVPPERRYRPQKKEQSDGVQG